MIVAISTLRSIAAGAAALMLAAAAAPAAGGTLHVQLRAIRSAHGSVQIDVYAATRKRAAGKRIPARRGAITVPFDDLSPGAYVVYVYHDENGNKKLDTGGLLGLPTEGYAFSNDAPARLGPPSVKAMTVIVPRSGAVQTVATMRYRK